MFCNLKIVTSFKYNTITFFGKCISSVFCSCPNLKKDVKKNKITFFYWNHGNNCWLYPWKNGYESWGTICKTFCNVICYCKIFWYQCMITTFSLILSTCGIFHLIWFSIWLNRKNLKSHNKNLLNQKVFSILPS